MTVPIGVFSMHNNILCGKENLVHISVYVSGVHRSERLTDIARFMSVCR